MKRIESLEQALNLLSIAFDEVTKGFKFYPLPSDPRWRDYVLATEKLISVRRYLGFQLDLARQLEPLDKAISRLYDDRI